ncbi:MAG: hypothetical protein ABMA01_00480 [Chthoniobacteraceae bacterium]
MSKRPIQRKQTKRSTKTPARAGTRRPRKRHLATPVKPVQRQFEFGTEGRYFDLRAIFERINARYFRNRLRGYNIVWGRRRRTRPKSYIVFGSIQEYDRVIRIHPLLDRQFVPQWYLEYVVFHEMLHAFVPDRYDRAGRRIVHHDGFLKRERRFRHYKRSVAWEEENLGRFLR